MELYEKPNMTPEQQLPKISFSLGTKFKVQYMKRALSLSYEFKKFKLNSTCNEFFK